MVYVYTYAYTCSTFCFIYSDIIQKKKSDIIQIPTLLSLYLYSYSYTDIDTKRAVFFNPPRIL